MQCRLPTLPARIGSGIVLLLLGLIAIASGLEAGAYVAIPGGALLLGGLYFLFRHPPDLPAE